MTRWSPVWIATVGLACVDGAGSLTDSDDTPTDGSNITNVTVTINELIPTVVHVAFDSAVSATAMVEWGVDDTLDHVTPMTVAGTSHEVLVLGLKAGHSHSLRPVVLEDDGSRVEGSIQTVELEPIPQEMSSLTRTIFDSERSQVNAGYLLTAVTSPGGTAEVIIDGEGDYVWYYLPPQDLATITIKPGRDGRSVVWTQHDKAQEEDRGNIMRVALDGSSVIETRALEGHHAFVEQADGEFAWLALTSRPTDLNGDGSPEELFSDRLLLGWEGMTEDDEPVELFNYFDDYPLNPIELDTDQPTAYGIQWTHANSLMIDATSSAYFVGSRWQDSILKIDATTGAVVWQMGGVLNEFSGMAAEDWWTHGHMSHIWEDGLVVFDNGYNLDATSRLVGYSFDSDAKTIAKEFEYLDPEGRFVQVGGDVRQLPGGNVLASWAQLGFFSEVTPSGEVVWQVETELGFITDRVTWIEDIHDLYEERL